MAKRSQAVTLQLSTQSMVFSTDNIATAVTFAKYMCQATIDQTQEVFQLYMTFVYDEENRHTISTECTKLLGSQWVNVKIYREEDDK